MVLENIFPLPENIIETKSNVLLIGLDGHCKTSILFRFSHTIANIYENNCVIYICFKKITKLPLFFKGMKPLSKSDSQRIFLIYPKSLDELLDYLAKLSKLSLDPSAIIVDDLNLFLKKNSNYKETYSMVLARVFALLIDTVKFIEFNKQHSCKLLVSSSYEDNGIEDFITIKGVGEHFFDQIYSIEKILPFGTTFSAFELMTTNKEMKLIYQVEDDEITFKKILKKKDTS